MDLLKTNIRYAENTAHDEDGKLQLIGWGARRGRTANDIPGQVRALELIREGKDWVFLDWKEPSGGGQVAAYKIQRRKRDGGEWTDAGMAVEMTTLHPQPPAPNAARRAGRVWGLSIRPKEIGQLPDAYSSGWVNISSTPFGSRMPNSRWP